MPMVGHRKTVKHYHEPGDCHELTFSCYRRVPLLTNDPWRRLLAKQIDSANQRHNFHLVAFVFMPEHLHLLVYPTGGSEVSDLLKAIKRPFSYRIKQILQEHQSPLLNRLTIRERPGKMTFRFWQEGPGYDRNLNTEKAVLAAIDDIHRNPQCHAEFFATHQGSRVREAFALAGKLPVAPDP
jgi:putative transposase